MAAALQRLEKYPLSTNSNFQQKKPCVSTIFDIAKYSLDTIHNSTKYPSGTNWVTMGQHPQQLHIF